MKRLALGCAVVGLLCLTLPAHGDLISYFNLDEGSGISVKGVGSIGDTNGTVQTPTGDNWVAGAPGGFSPTSGYDFAGGDSDEFILTDATAFDWGIEGNNAKSVSAWVLTRDFANGGIFDIGVGGANYNDFSLRTYNNTTDLWRAQFWGDDLDITASGSLTTGRISY
jgi:hypothetical protein